MAKQFSYIDKSTGQPGMTLDQWIESIQDVNVKATAIKIKEAEVSRHAEDANGDSSTEFVIMFERYLKDCNIDLVVTEE
jgi:hypothetical protein